MKFLVTSTKDVKVNGVKKALAEYFQNDNFEVIGVKVNNTGVPENPKGEEQGYAGASNRMKTVFEQHPDADYIFSFENAVVSENGKHYDTIFGCFSDKKHYVQCSNILSNVPNAIYQQTLNTDLTIGQAMVKMGLTNAHADPYLIPYGISREAKITENANALLSIFIFETQKSL